MSTAVLFQTMPPLSVDEYANLEQSIRDHGIQVPILVDEEGVVIDGHHRQKIAESLDIKCPVEVKFGMSEAEKRSLSVSLNIDRRQLSREQRRAIIAESIKADPDLSNRQHAERAGVDHKTVGSIRDALVDRGEIPHVEERTDSIGRQQPASKPVPVTKISDSHKEETFWNAETGEMVEEPTPVKAVAPKVPRPVPTGDEAARLNAEQLAFNFGRSLVNLEALVYPQHRERVIREWPIGHDAATPDAQELASPESFRAIAVALNQLADEWERTNG